MHVVRNAISDLRAKYVEMRALRHAGDAAPPRERLAALASRFPGALREIDDLPLAEIDRRIEALARAEADPSACVVWMEAMSRFHALARGVLFAKRSITDDARVRATWPAEARAWVTDLERVARPPRGRVMDLVYERLGDELGISAHAAKALVFGPSRRERC